MFKKILLLSAINADDGSSCDNRPGEYSTVHFCEKRSQLLPLKKITTCKSYCQNEDEPRILTGRDCACRRNVKCLVIYCQQYPTIFDDPELMSLVELSAKIVNDNVVLKSADLSGMMESNESISLELDDIKGKKRRRNRNKKGSKQKAVLTTSTTSTTSTSSTSTTFTTTSTTSTTSTSTTSTTLSADLRYDDYEVDADSYWDDVAYESAYPSGAYDSYDYSSYVEIDHDAFAADLQSINKKSKKSKKVKKTSSTRKTPAFTVATLKMAADDSEIVDDGMCKTLPAWLSPGNCIFPVSADSQCEPGCALGFEKKQRRDGGKKARCECDATGRCTFETDFKCVPACDRNVLDDTMVGLVPKCKFPISGGDHCDFECVFGTFNQVERANGKCSCRNGHCSFTQPKAECAPKHHQYCRTPNAKVDGHPNGSVMCQSMKKVSLLGKSTFVSAKVDQKCWIECEKGFEWQSADPDDDLKYKLIHGYSTLTRSGDLTCQCGSKSKKCHLLLPEGSCVPTGV